MITFWEVSDTGKLTINVVSLYDFLNKRGYRKEFRDKELIVYRIKDYFIELVEINALVNEVSHYLKYEVRENTSRTIEFDRKGEQEFIFTPAQILEAVTKFGFKRIFDKLNWNHLADLDVKIKRHVYNAAFYYFKNGYVEVTADGPKFRDYSELPVNEKVFLPLVIPRDIQLIDIENEQQQKFCKRGRDFMHYLSMISSKEPEGDKDNADLEIQWPINEDKQAYLLKLVGYVLHDYKERGKTDFAPMWCDENVGGTGKGTLLQAITQILDPNGVGAICEVDGGKSQEKYDPVELNTQTRLKAYNDISQDFLKRSIYNEITDSATIRQMYGGMLRVPYAQSWKIMVLANFALQGGDGHLLRRFRVFYMTPFFHRDRTIIDYYGHSFFGSEWEQQDWIYFFNVLFWCVKLWLRSNYYIKYEDPDFIEFKLNSTYYPELREYLDALPTKYYSVAELFENFKSHSKWKEDSRIKGVNPKQFAKWATNYFNETGRKWNFNHNRTERWIGPKPNTPPKQGPAKQSELPF